MFATSYGRRGCLGRAAPRPRGEDPGQRARGGSRCMANLCSPFGKPCGVSAAGSLYVLRALDGIATHSGMQHSKARSPGPGERAIAACSLAVLAAVLAGVCIRQTRFDPAVMMSAGVPPAAPAQAMPGLLEKWPAGLSPMSGAEAFSPGTLSDKIDGKADLYLSAGFVSLKDQRVALAGGAGSWMEMLVFDMGLPANAFSVYSSQRRPNAADAGIADYSYEADNELCLVHGNYYVELVCSDSSARGGDLRSGRQLRGGVCSGPVHRRGAPGARPGVRAALAGRPQPPDIRSAPVIPPDPGPGPVATRREFFRRGLRAGAAIAATGGLGAWLWNRHPPGDFGRTQASNPRKDFAVRAAGPRMAIATGRDRAAMLRRALAAMGGIERFIGRGDRVMLKVNAAFATPAILGATTHPDLVAELARLCRAAGAASVIVTDNPINSPESCFELTGIGAAARASGAGLFVPRQGSFRAGTLPGGRLIRDWPVLDEPFAGVTKLIGVAPVKGHQRAGASMTMKNWRSEEHTS